MNHFVIQYAGTVEDISIVDNGMQRYECIGEKGEFYLYLADTSLVLDNSGEPIELEVGMEITAYIVDEKPMILVFPPIYTADLVIVQTEKTGLVKVTVFNEEMVSQDDDLKLTMHDDVAIENLLGEVVPLEEAMNRQVAVFYWRTTFSIPPQTSPEKIIVLE